MRRGLIMISATHHAKYLDSPCKYCHRYIHVWLNIYSRARFVIQCHRISIELIYDTIHVHNTCRCQFCLHAYIIWSMSNYVHDIQLFMYMCTCLKAHIKHNILFKISPLPSLSSKFLHRYFYLVYKPSPSMIQKNCIFSKKWMSKDRQGWWLISLTCQLFPLNIMTKSSLMAVMTYT